MNDHLYRDELLDLVRASAIQKKVRKPNIVIEDFNSLCGDRLKISIRTRDGVIEDYGFEGNGCLISQASTYLLKDRLIGKSIEDAKNVQDDEMLAVLGIDNLTPSRLKCALMAIRAIRAKI